QPPPGGISSCSQRGVPQGAESKSQFACSPGPLMVGMDLEQTETRSRPLSTSGYGRGYRQRDWIRAGWMDGRPWGMA
ncbi:unnamed protein product, partial [Staurois parvus]